MSDNLPESQLSIFCLILQILFEYTHPNVSGDQVSNRIDKKWQFKTENGQILVSRIAIYGWDIIWIHGPYRIKKSGVKLNAEN